MLTVELAITCRLRGKLITPHQTKLIDSFVAFAAFRPMVFHFTQAKQKWKNYRDQSRLTFSVPPHQTPPRRIASLLNSLFAIRACAPKCEPARRVSLSWNNFFSSRKPEFLLYTQNYYAVNMYNYSYYGYSIYACVNIQELLSTWYMAAFLVVQVHIWKTTYLNCRGRLLYFHSCFGCVHKCNEHSCLCISFCWTSQNAFNCIKIPTFLVSFLLIKTSLIDCHLWTITSMVIFWRW